MTDMSTASARAELLVQALPHMQRYDQEIVVIKYGGHAMGDSAAAEDFAEDIVLLEQAGVKPIICHGGGPQIGAMLDKLGIRSEFRDGLRVTDQKTVEVVEMVLAGSINKQIVSWIAAEGGKAVGLCGKDGSLVTAKKLLRSVVDPGSKIEAIVDLGLPFFAVAASCAVGSAIPVTASDIESRCPSSASSIDPGIRRISNGS